MYRRGYTATSTSPVPIKPRIRNGQASAASQHYDSDPVIAGTTAERAANSSVLTSYVNWSTAQTPTVNWTGASSADTVNFRQMAVYAKE